jgi:serine/threonine protein kinase
MQLQENTVVAERFRLVRMIGRGGMGSVWQAVQIGLDRPCALKFIEGELANLAEAHSRFEREAKAAAHLHSPHVVQIYDHGVWQGTPYIAMELLDGEDLGKRLTSAGGKLPPDELNVIVQQVCRALTKAHGAGIVHRDLKPDNIFLVRDDDREIVKILDFGVAKQTAQAIDGSNTKTGAMLGTPYYMSPEQAQGIKSVDARSDLWSLAVIVFQGLTGRLPFESEALGDLLVKIIVPAPLPVPTQINPALPAGIDRWWQKAGERNPDLRFQTARELAEALQLSLGQSSITEISDGAGPRLGAGTALMPNAPRGSAPFLPNHTAAMSTPNPAGHAPQLAMTPPGFLQAHASTGGPVALSGSGLSAPGVPRKGPPVALLVGVGGLALVGLVLGGVALVSRSNATAEGTGPAAASATVAAVEVPEPKAAPPPTEPPEPPPPTAAAAEVPPPEVEPEPEPTAASATPSTGKKPSSTRPATTAKPTTATATKPAPSATTAAKPQPTNKPFSLGF